jgi:hypothetical protein
MPKIKIIYPVAGGAPDAEVDMEVQSLQHSARDHLVLDHPVGLRLVELFGDGYGELPFTLVDGPMGFTGCRIEDLISGCTISYMRVGPYPPSDPDPIVFPVS